MKEFLNYFKVITRVPKFRTVPIGTIIAIVALYLINIFAVADGSCWFAYLALFAFVMGISVFYRCYDSPNMEAAFPVNHKKKLLFRFLSSLLLFLIFVVAVIVVVILVYFFRWISEPLFTFDLWIIRDAFRALGLYGWLFGIAYFIVMYSAGMITGFIKRRRNRNIFLACLCGGVLLFYLITGITYNNNYDEFSGPRLPFSEHYYEFMRLPWLFIVFCFLIAAAMLGWAIYLGIKHYNPKKF